jgi:hypothetical protein
LENERNKPTKSEKELYNERIKYFKKKIKIKLENTEGKTEEARKSGLN